MSEPARTTADTRTIGTAAQRGVPVTGTVYQLRVVLAGISPIVWRRLLVPAETSVADLHAIMQTQGVQGIVEGGPVELVKAGQQPGQLLAVVAQGLAGGSVAFAEDGGEDLRQPGGDEHRRPALP